MMLYTDIFQSKKADFVHDRLGRFATLGQPESVRRVLSFINSKAFKLSHSSNKNTSTLSGENRLSKDYVKEFPRDTKTNDNLGRNTAGSGLHIIVHGNAEVTSFSKGQSDHWDGYKAIGTGLPFDEKGTQDTYPNDGKHYLHAELKRTTKLISRNHLEDTLKAIYPLIEAQLIAKSLAEDVRLATITKDSPAYAAIVAEHMKSVEATIQHLNNLFKDKGLAAGVLGADALSTFKELSTGERMPKILVVNKHALIIHKTTLKKEETSTPSFMDISSTDLDVAGKKQPEQAQIRKPRNINVRTRMSAVRNKPLKRIG